MATEISMINLPFSQKLFDLLSSLLPAPGRMQGEILKRNQPCRFCGELQAQKLAQVDYWDLAQCSLVRCSRCALMQVDPMLTSDQMALGCKAYYYQDRANQTSYEYSRNCVRNYRRGIAFASRLRGFGIKPSRVLEIGPGSGYFARGLLDIFPQAQIAVADLVDEVLEANRKLHPFRCINGTPESLGLGPKGQYDLVIARDILEHVADIGETIRVLARLLEPGGHLHFIVPNGHQDAWRFYATCLLTHKPAELLINHVNFFDGKGLCDFLLKNGFVPVRYYTYGFKSIFRGMGWRLGAKESAPVSTRVSAAKQMAGNENGKIHFPKPSRLKQLYRGKRGEFCCRYKDFWPVKVSPQRNIGHEIFGLFKKSG